MSAENYLQVTEIGTGAQHKILLETLREGPITLGRSASNPRHIQIGVGADSCGFISSCQCTLSAELSEDQWSYFVQDGCRRNESWQPSKTGIWVGNRSIADRLELTPGAGHVVIFPKINNDLCQSNFHCILEWPCVKDNDLSQSEPPTLQQYQAALTQKNAYWEEARRGKEQLERLGRKMSEMQLYFTKERELLDEKMNKQSDLLINLSATLEEERQVNSRQQKMLIQQQARNKRVRLSIAVLGGVVIAIAVLALNVDQDTLKSILEWSLFIVGAAGAIVGITDGTNKQ